MPDLVLRLHANSPVSEKIRLLCGQTFPRLSAGQALSGRCGTLARFVVGGLAGQVIWTRFFCR